MQPNRNNTSTRNSTSPRNTDQSTKTNNINQLICNDELVNLINILSDSIKEYYKVCKNILKNKSTLIASMEFQINQTNSLADDLINEGYDINKISQIKDSTTALNNIYNKLQLNFVSDEKNLTFFFEDAKILFRKMKTKRQENIKTFYQKVNRNSTPMNKNKIPEQIRNSKSVKNQQVNFLDTNANLDMGGIYNTEGNLNDDLQMQDTYKTNITSSGSVVRKKTNSKISQKFPESFNNCYYGNFVNEDNKNLNNNQQSKKSFGSDEIIKVKNMNKQYYMYIQKLKKEISNYQIQLEKYKNMKNPNDIRKIDVNNTINSRKENDNLNEENKKLMMRYNELLKSYKKSQEISKKLIDENNRLRRMNLNSKNNNNQKEQFSNNENNSNSSYLNSLNKLKNDLEISNKKFAEISTLLTNERAKNLNLQKTLNKSKLEFKKEIGEKNNLIINLKNTINNLNNQNPIENNNENNVMNFGSSNAPTVYDSNSNKLIEDLKKQNEQLKLMNQKYEYSISQYKSQLSKSISEINNKANDSDNSFVFMKKYYDTMKEELENKNQMLLNELNDCRNLNESLNKQIENLIQDNNTKELNLQKINDIQNQLYEKEEENKKLLKTINDSKIKNNNINSNNDNNLIDEINKLKKENELLIQKISYNNNLNDNDSSQKSNHEKFTNQINKLLKENNELEETNKKNLELIKKQKEEIEGLNQLIYKIQKDRENIDEQIKILKRENEKLKKQLEHLSSTLPEEFNDLQKQYNILENKLKETRSRTPNTKLSKSVNTIDNNNLDITTSEKRSNRSVKNKDMEKLNKELQEAKLQINNLKKKNEALVTQLEEKEIKKECYDNKSEDGNLSNYEEEFDLRKMAKGAKDKNRSQDINIDYPGIQQIKEKYRELDFYYNSLEGLVKKLLLTIKCNPKNKTYITELCRIVGFDLDTTNKIVTNKNTKTILGFFPK